MIVRIPKAFEGKLISPRDLFEYDLVADISLVKSDEYTFYPEHQSFPRSVACWAFPLNRGFQCYRGDPKAELFNEFGHRTGAWLRKATFKIFRGDSAVIEWVLHETNGAFIMKFFDWEPKDAHRLNEL